MADQPTRCYICGKHDENEDHTLWIVCTPDDPHDKCCQFPCHINCAFDKKCLGVIENKTIRPLDSQYWCISCGKVSDILGLWKQQIVIVKEAHFVKDLCNRLSLCYKLMDKSVRFETLHKYVRVTKEMVEATLGEPIGHCTEEVGHSTVSSHSFAHDVHKLCADVIVKVDKLMASKEWKSRVDPYPPACRVIFEEISSTSIKIILMSIPSARTEILIGFNIWCWRSQQELCPHDQDLSFPPSKNRATISRLQPSTEYTIQIVSYTLPNNPFGITTVKCTTRAVGIVHNKPNLDYLVGIDQNDRYVQDHTADGEPSYPVEVPDLNTSGIPMVLDLNDVPMLSDLNVELSTEPLLEEIGEVTMIENIERDIIEENHGEPSILPLKVWSRRDCVLMIFNLERQGLITERFRMQFVTWFGLKAKEEERQLVYDCFEALSDKPGNLVQQLIHSFSDII